LWHPFGINSWPGSDAQDNTWNGGFSVGYMRAEAVSRMWSPYQLNPFDIN